MSSKMLHPLVSVSCIIPKGNSGCGGQSPNTTQYSPALTCGKDDISGHQLVIDNGELRQLDPGYPRHSRLASFPVELDVVCGVAICTRTHTYAKV